MVNIIVGNNINYCSFTLVVKTDVVYYYLLFLYTFIIVWNEPSRGRISLMSQVSISA